MVEKKSDKEMVEKESDKEILNVLNKSENGLSITNVVDKTKLSRSYVRTALAVLKASGKIKMRNVGVAKIYYIG